MDGLRNIFLGVNNRFATTRSDITVQSGSVARTPVERDRLLLLPLSRECKARWWRTPRCNFQRRIYTAYNELATPLRMHRAYSSSAQDDSLKVLRDVFFWNVADVSLVRHCNFFFPFLQFYLEVGTFMSISESLNQSSRKSFFRLGKIVLELLLIAFKIKCLCYYSFFFYCYHSCMHKNYTFCLQINWTLSVFKCVSHLQFRFIFASINVVWLKLIHQLLISYS